MGTWSRGSATSLADYYTGTSSSETADGLGGNDTLVGSGGNDSLIGNTGDDSILGGTGSDTLNGGDGNDSLADSDGYDIFYGGAGNDTISDADNSPFGDTTYIDAGSGDDTIFVSSAISGGTIVGGSNTDVLDFFVSGTDTAVDLSAFTISGVERLNGSVTFSGTLSQFEAFTTLRYSSSDATLNSRMLITLLDAGTLNLASELGSQAAFIRTANGNNVISSGSGSDRLLGNNGIDNMYGGAGNDLIEGDDGDDTLLGQDGGDSIYSGYDDDYVDGGYGDDMIYDIGGNDTLLGLDGNDSLFDLNFADSGQPRVRMYGEAGDDWLYASTYYAEEATGTISGGLGTDTLVVYGASLYAANMTLDAEHLITSAYTFYSTAAQLEAFDTIRYSASDSGLDVQALLVLSDPIPGPDIVLDLSEELGAQSVNIAPRFVSTTRFTLTTGSGNDSLTGSNSTDVLSGNAGDDTLYGGGSSDTLDGGTGADQMYGGAGSDDYYVDSLEDGVNELAGEGTDLVISSLSLTLMANVEQLRLTGTATTGTGNGLSNYLYANATLASTLMGMDGNDTQVGYAAADRLEGGSGHDYLAGGERWDTLYGGEGNDTLIGGIDNDQMYGGLGDDIYYVDNAGDRVNESTTANEGFDWVVAFITWNMTANVENVTLGNAGNTSSIGNSLHNLMTGNIGNNTLIGGLGHDTINGGDGNDSLDGGIDSDVLDGGSGNDTVLGGQRWDTLTGGAGDDVLDGGTENDRMTGNAGNDTYYMDHTGDRVIEAADEGTDLVYSSIDWAMWAEVEDLTLTGAAVTGTGNGLANRITGNANANILSGGNGNDTLTGGAGADTLTGGTGRDDFVFNAAATNGTDRIADFVHAIDRLVFKGSDYGFAAGHVLTAAQFTVGTAAVGATAQFIWDAASGHLYWDADGTGAAARVDLALFDGAPGITKEDLIFTA